MAGLEEGKCPNFRTRRMQGETAASLPPPHSIPLVQINPLKVVIHMQRSTQKYVQSMSHKRLFTTCVCSPSRDLPNASWRLALAWVQCLPGWWKPDVFRPGVVGMRQCLKIYIPFNGHESSTPSHPTLEFDKGYNVGVQLPPAVRTAVSTVSEGALGERSCQE